MFVSVEQLVDKNIGKYKLTKLIGMSVLSAVYEAVPAEQASPVMLTLFRLPEECVGEAWELFMERFEYEADRLKGLQHPHVVPYYEFGEEFGYPYLITPFTANRTLADLLKQDACTPAQMMYLLRQIASGLDYVHSAGIVHGSLKPSNILLRDEPGGPRVLIANVGLTQILEMRGIGQVSYSHPHLFSVAGTLLTNPAYLAPEVVQGEPSDARSDIYALGILVYEMLCGRPPFTGIDPLDVALQHVDQRIPPLQSIRRELPQVLDGALRRALERDPDRRIQRAEKLVSSFERTAPISQEISKEDAAFIAQMASNKAARVMQSEQQWQGMPGITRERMPSLAPEFATNSTGLARRSNSSQFRPPRSGALPAGVTRSASQVDSAPRTEQMSKSSKVSSGIAPVLPLPAAQMTPSGMQSSTTKRPLVLPPGPLATQISSGLQAVQASEMLVRQISPSVQSSGRSPASAGAPAPNGYGAPPMGQPYAMIQSAPLQIQSGNYANQVNSGNVIGGSIPTNASMQPGAMYNNDPRYGQPQQQYMDGYGQPQQQYMGGYGYEQQDLQEEQLPNKGRRTLVIVGAAVAAAVLGAGGLNLVRIMQSKSDSNTTQKTPSGETQTGGQKTGQAASTTTNKATGMLIANQKALAVNATQDFINPVDKHPSILLHLSNGNFVAYDKACTHQGIEVAFDPKTSTLVCPLHHSVFDPVNNGAVLRGPAFVRLPQVTIHVNADGSITAG